MTKREVLKYLAETGSCPVYIDCTDCPYEKRCVKLTVLIRKIGARELLKMFPEKRKFDINNVFTCVTAIEAKVGSKGYFGDNLSFLRAKVKNREQTSELTEILDENNMCRFRHSDGLTYSLFYPVEVTE